MDSLAHSTKSLTQELRALEPPVDPARVPAAFGDWRDARILLEVSGGRITFALFAKGHEETAERRRVRRLGAHKRVRSRDISGQSRNGMVVVINGLQSGMACWLPASSPRASAICRI
jgi:hypothetical protein